MEVQREEKRGESRANDSKMRYLSLEKNKKIMITALMAFLVITASIIVFFLIFRFQGLSSFFKLVFGILQPIIFGIVIAYLLNPIVVFLEKNFIRLFQRVFKKPDKAKKFSRGLSIILAVIFMISIISILMFMIIPGLNTSISNVVKTIPSEITKYEQRLINYLESDQSILKNKTIAKSLPNTLDDLTNTFTHWMKTKLSDLLPTQNGVGGILTNVGNVFSTLTNSVFTVLKILLNFVIGIIVSIYILSGKENFIGQGKRILYSLTKPSTANYLLCLTRKTHEIFGGFISGKLVDSLIIGLLTFIALTCMNMPYTLLVSVIVGVTNVIPFFGPYLGAIPSALLILLVNPLKGLYFIIFILILQQIDGNIIGPKILGDSTGLSAFWVLFSILLFGGLWGIVGMIIGVPTWAVISYIFNDVLEHFLKKKQLPLHSADYEQVNYYDEVQKKLIYLKTQKQTPEKQTQTPEKQTPEKQTPEKQTLEKQTSKKQTPEK